MLISVIIPVYNVSRYLRQCVDCVLNQTYRQLQIILVDDGSTDGSAQMCDEYARQDERIRVIHKPNGGLSDARNVGTENAKGDYIVYLDADDCWNSNGYLQKMLDSIIVSGADMSMSLMSRFVDEKDIPVSRLFIYEEQDFRGNALQTFERLYRKQQYSMSACNKMIKTSILRDNNILFTKGLLGEDMDWTSRLLPHVLSVCYCNEAVYLYRERPGSITKTFRLKNAEDFCWILETWEAYWCNYPDKKTAKVFLGYYALLYVTLVYNYLLVPSQQRQQVKQRICNLSSLLVYSNAPKSDRLKRLKDMFSVSLMLYIGAWIGSVRKQGLFNTIKAL